jgi:WD40 repeat protein
MRRLAMTIRNKLCVATFLIVLSSLFTIGACCWTWWDGQRTLQEPDLLVALYDVGDSGEVRPIFTPLGDDLILAGKKITLINVRQGTRRPLADSGQVCSLSLRRDGKELVSVREKGLVQLWNLETGIERRRFSLDGVDLVGWAALSPDDKTLVTTGKELDEIIAWDVDTGQSQAKFGGPGLNISEGVFSPDGKWLVTFGSSGDFVKLWMVPGFTVKATLGGHFGAIFDAVFAPDGKILATTSNDGLRLWEIPSGTLIAHVSGWSGTANCLTFAPDGRTLGAGYGSPTGALPGDPAKVELWDVASRKVVSRWTARDRSWVTKMCFSPDGTKLATVMYNGDVSVWDVSQITQPPK